LLAGTAALLTMYVWSTQPGASGGRILIGLIFTISLLAAAAVWARRRRGASDTVPVRPTGRLTARAAFIGVAAAVAMIAIARLALQVLDGHSGVAWIAVYLVGLMGTWILQTVWKRFERRDCADG
jgi:hypothetical protein